MPSARLLASTPRSSPGVADAHPSRHDLARRHQLLQRGGRLLHRCLCSYRDRLFRRTRFPRAHSCLEDAGVDERRHAGTRTMTSSPRRPYARLRRVPRVRRSRASRPGASCRECARARGGSAPRAVDRSSSACARAAAHAARTSRQFHCRRVHDAGDDETGVVEPCFRRPGTEPFELVLNGGVVDTFVAGGTVPSMIFVGVASGPAPAEVGDEDDPVLTWRAAAAGARRGAAAGRRTDVHGPDQRRRSPHFADGRFALREPQVGSTGACWARPRPCACASPPRMA